MVGVAETKMPTAIPMATYRGSPFSALVRFVQCLIFDFILAPRGDFFGSIPSLAFIEAILLIHLTFSIFGTLPIRKSSQFQRSIL
jgi:hypothetical protein